MAHCTYCGRKLVEKLYRDWYYPIERFDPDTGQRVDRTTFLARLVCPRYNSWFRWWHNNLPNGACTKDTYLE